MLPSLNSIATQVLLTMVHFLWQGAVLFVAVLVTVVLRRRSPNLRYGIQLALLLLMAVCPVVTFFVAIVPPDPQVALQFAPKEPTESVTIIISEPTGDGRPSGRSMRNASQRKLKSNRRVIPVELSRVISQRLSQLLQGIARADRSCTKSSAGAVRIQTSFCGVT